MAEQFLTEDFLLQTKTARELYHEYAAKMPIFDYHCHLPVKQIADDLKFENLTQIRLHGDHYKWRAMRTNGIDEKYITGDASDYEKFEKWAQTVPYTIRNPLYHWTHMELKRYFGVQKLLMLKSLLMALLEPVDRLRTFEQRGDFTSRLAMLEELKTLPLGAIWDYYCLRSGVPVGLEWMKKVKDYEANVTSKR